MLNVEGRFKAQVLAHGTEQNDKTGSVQFGFTVRITQQLQGDEWRDVEPDEITGYQNIIDKKGGINDIGVKCLQDSLGWTGADFNSLNNNAFVGVIVQITTAFETYQEKTRLRVQYLNPENYEGFAIKPMDAAKVNALQSKYGAMLRAKAPKAALPPMKRGTDLAQPVKENMTVSKEDVGQMPDLSIPADAIPPDEQTLPDLDGPPPEPPKPATKQEAWDAVFKRCENDRALATTEWNALLKKYGQDWDKIIAHDGIPF